MRTYEKYKESGIQWIGEIPEHWELTKLKYIGNLYSGLSGKSGDDFKQEDSSLNKPFIPFTNIANNEKINPLNMQYVVINEDDYQNKVQKNDLFFMMSSENFDDVGKSTILVDEIGEVYLNSFCKGFRISSNNVCAPFLNYLLLNHASRRRLMIEANGFTRINLKMEKVNDFEIELPPLPEQTAIANYLDSKTTEIDQVVADKEALVSLYEEEKKALINEAVTEGLNANVKFKASGIDWLGDVPEHWAVKKLKYWIELITTKASNESNKIGLENIESNTGQFIETDSEFEGEGILFGINDILFGKLRPYLAKVYLSTFEGAAVGDFFVFRCRKEVDPKFIQLRMIGYSFIDICNSSTFGAKMPRVSYEFISNLEIVVPPYEEQTAIVQYIESETANINDKINQIKQEIVLLKEYRQAIIFEAVTGKVRVHDLPDKTNPTGLNMNSRR